MLDNIVCFWQPVEPINAASEFSFAYKLYWSGLPPVRSGLARIDATRTGIGGFPEGWAPGEHFPEQCTCCVLSRSPGATTCRRVPG